MNVASRSTPRGAGRETLGGFRPQLLSFAQRRLGNREHAEDAVQETLLAALEGLERFGGGSSLGTWLFAILKHKIVDVMRRAGLRAARGHGHEHRRSVPGALDLLGQLLGNALPRTAEAPCLPEVRDAILSCGAGPRKWRADPLEVSR